MPDGTTRLHRADGTPLFQYSALGTLAERVCVSGTSCVRVPMGLAPEVAALIGCGAATGWGSVVNTAEVRPGQAVAVVGCGGVGLSAVMAAAACGAKPLVAVDRVAEKLAAARDLGATHTVLATGDSWWREVRAITDGLDVGLDCIGDPEVVTGLVAASVPGATVVLVGMTAEGVQVPLDGYRVPDAGLRILGSAYGSCVATRDFPRIARLSLDGRLPLHRLVSHRIGLADVPEAFAAMRRGERLRSIVTFA
jgi:S-(hydroxymethyl)glutathione dehydrogenase/alcohol dehydrogenase